MHAASPFHFNVTDPYKDLINPAVNGTENILKSAFKEPKVQRIVITSSFAGESMLCGRGGTGRLGVLELMW